VSVIYVDSDENGVKLTPIGIEPQGEFEIRWPQGFFKERSKELFDL
jgi:hypothetical protein